MIGAMRTVCFFLLFPAFLHAEWTTVGLPHSHVYPPEENKKVETQVETYSLRIPTSPVKWYAESECFNALEKKPAERTTSKRFTSDKIKDVSGLSFKGLVYKSKLGSRKNEFAVFFHENACYHGQAEYGWVFPESRKEGVFYLCANCNLGPEQKWCTWPDIGEGSCPVRGAGCAKLRELLENPTAYRYWNIKVSRSGTFLVELVDPVSWKVESCELEKPDWFPNLYNKAGYITVNAQKKADVALNQSPVLHVDEVKIWH
jgi:hypothetical protein